MLREPPQKLEVDELPLIIGATLTGKGERRAPLPLYISPGDCQAGSPLLLAHRWLYDVLSRTHSSLPSLSSAPVLMSEMSFTSFSLIAIGEQASGPRVQMITPPLSPS